MSLLVVFGQTLAIYLFLIAALGFLGRSQMATLTPVAYLLIALLGSAVETGLYAGKASLASGLVSAATLVAADWSLTSLLNRWPRLRRWLAGRPVVLVHDGAILWPHLRQVRLTEENLRAAIRKHGYHDPEDIHLAVLEMDGSVGVVPKRPARGH